MSTIPQQTHTRDKQKTNNKTIDLCLNILMVTLNVNGLNTETKREGLSDPNT